MFRTESGCCVLETEEDVKSLNIIKAVSVVVVGVDVETKKRDGEKGNPDPWKDEVVGIGVSFYRPWSVTEEYERITTVYALAAVPGYVDWLRDNLGRWPWYAHNAMFDATALRRLGIRLGEHRGDPRIIAYLLGEPEAKLKPLLKTWLGTEVMEFDDVLSAHGAASIDGVPLPVQGTYCGSQDAELVVPLERAMRAKLDPSLLDIYELERDMVNILVDMTEEGVTFDREEGQRRLDKERQGLTAVDAVIAAEVERLGFVQYETRKNKEGITEIWRPVCKECRNGKKKRLTCKSCGGKGRGDSVIVPFNTASTAHLSRLLYVHLKLPVTRYTESHEPSTDVLTLLRLKDTHSLVPLILSRRKFAKREQFLTRWLELSSEDGKLHTQYRNTTVSTGRLSSSEPNLQQVTLNFRDLFVARVVGARSAGFTV